MSEVPGLATGTTLFAQVVGMSAPVRRWRSVSKLPGSSKPLVPTRAHSLWTTR